MSVKEYTLRFHQLSRYASKMAASMRDIMHKVVLGLSPELVLESKVALLISDMNICRFVLYMQ